MDLAENITRKYDNNYNILALQTRSARRRAIKTRQRNYDEETEYQEVKRKRKRERE